MTVGDIPEDLIITIDDVRRLHCVNGARGWWRERGLDFRHFLKHGIAARELFLAGDAQSEEVIRVAMEDRHG